MSEIGLKSYRFSVSWPRVLPRMNGPVNRQGLDFYDRLVDGLLAAKIDPFVTLYHWDLPQWMQDAGGWPLRDVAGYFADYATLMARRLGDRVRRWTTFNEPWLSAFMGYKSGFHAPGLVDEKLGLDAVHHLLLAHGLATQAIRSVGPELEVGIVLDMWPIEPGTPTERDRIAAELAWQRGGKWMLSPLLRAQYPMYAWLAYGKVVPVIQPDDMAQIAQRLDFLGINNYSRSIMVDGRVVWPGPDAEYTEMGWEVHPPALFRLLVGLKRDYPMPPIYITENGAAFADRVDPDGQIHDTRRIAFLRNHLREVLRAIEAGVDIRGYFVWSLLDNFEWTYGYAKRFGIVRVDRSTQQRKLKDSAKWYAEVIRRNGLDE